MTTTTLTAYHGDPNLKDQTLTKIRAHQKADQIIQGYYWQANEDGVYRGIFTADRFLHVHRQVAPGALSEVGIAAALAD